MGSLALLMLQHMTGGGWDRDSTTLEAGTRTLPLVLILFVPIVVGADLPLDARGRDGKERGPHREGEILKPFVLHRARGNLLWHLADTRLLSEPLVVDAGQDAKREYGKRMRVLSGPGMVLFVFTVTFAAIDWFMSLDPEWSSTIYGFIYVRHELSSGFCHRGAGVALWHEPMNNVVAQAFSRSGQTAAGAGHVVVHFAFRSF